MVLLPLPGDDSSLLGRLVVRQPPPGADLFAYTRPNPCGQYLTPATRTALESHYVDSMGDQANVDARLLESFGFGASASRATHLTYDLRTSEELTVNDTTDYEACCAQTNCGYGFVSSLVYGFGEYAAAEASQGSVGTPVGTATLGASGQMQVLQSRRIQGWVAASVHPHHGASGSAGVGRTASRRPVTNADGIDDRDIESMTEGARRAYGDSRILVLGSSDGYTFVDGTGKHITENEFIERYADVTGSAELNKYWEHRRMKFVKWIGAPLFVAGAALVTLGALTATRDCTADDYWLNGGPLEDGCTGTRDAPSGTTTSDSSFFLYFFGGSMLLGGTTVSIVFYAMPNGSPRSHNISQVKASEFAERYNRALRERPSLSPETPGFGFSRAPGPGLSLSGSF